MGAPADHVRSYYAALNTGDADAVAAHFTPDATHWYTRRPPSVGAAEIGEHTRLAVEHLRAEWRIEHLVEGVDEVVIEWTMGWDHPKTGERCLDRGAEFLALRDGLICEVRAYYSRDGDLVGFDHEARGHTMLPAPGSVPDMPDAPDFAATITAAYAVEGPAIDLGRGVLGDALYRDAVVQAPLAMLTRHGLIAGATGTGKTKTLQGLAEQLSAAGVPVVVADVKGDLSGLLEPGAPDGPGARRDADLGIPFAPTGFPVELLSIGGIGPGVPVRATVSDFGPQLLAKILGANETQESSLTLVFHYADAKALPLLDLSDLRALLTFLDSKEGKADLEGIGGLSKQTVGVLLRNLVTLETGGGTEFFGEPQLDIADLMRTAPDGRGVISCVELPAVQDKPKLFSTVLMWMLAELFETLPEEGDVEQPKLVFFFDEAHLLFSDASKAFVESVTQTVRLIRSKGVGVFFVTQSPKDIPADVLGQLGNRVQHALRAFTPDDQKALSAAVKTYPRSDFYDLEQLLQQLGIGEAVVTILDEKGVPTPVVHSRLPGTRSLMDRAAADLDATAKASPLYATYGTRTDAESARELLAARVAASAAAAQAAAPPPEAPKPKPKPPKDAGGVADTIGDVLNSSQGKQVQREVIRGIFGMLKKRF